MTYFQNEIWDTGGDGRITIEGDIYSTANPLGIFISATPFEVLTLGTAGSEINSDFNVVGTFTVNGAPISGGGSPFTDSIDIIKNASTASITLAIDALEDTSLYMINGATLSLNIFSDTATLTHTIAGSDNIYIDADGDLGLNGGTITMTGNLFINGQSVTFGANDSAGVGYRTVRVPNI